MIDIIFDMETGDPDDFLTLLLLLGHPAVNLKAVTVFPGTRAQLGLVRRAVSWFGRDLPIGAFDVDSSTPSVSPWHYRAYGEPAPSHAAEPGPDLLLRLCDERTTLVTGGPPSNLGAAVERGGLVLGRWVAQGGFAGTGVVPNAVQLEKFRGKSACPSYNFDQAPIAARAALDAPGILTKRLVSKNVCHGVIYDASFHSGVGAMKEESLSLRLIWQGMDEYLRRRPKGKKLHDPLAACCAIDEAIGTWAEVEMLREQAGWSARPLSGSGTFIITDYDRARFIAVLTAH